MESWLIYRGTQPEFRVGEVPTEDDTVRKKRRLVGNGTLCTKRRLVGIGTLCTNSKSAQYCTYTV